MITALRRRFDPGQILATPGAMEAMLEANTSPLELLLRHVTGNWGDLGDEDKAANERALKDGSRLFSAYHLQSGVKVWVITESDRSATTILLPDEY